MGNPFFSVIIQSSNINRYDAVYKNLSEDIFWKHELKKQTGCRQSLSRKASFEDVQRYFGEAVTI